MRRTTDDPVLDYNINKHASTITMSSVTVLHKLLARLKAIHQIAVTIMTAH